MRDVTRGQGRAAILAIGLASALVVGVLDYLAGRQLPLTIVYLLPIYFVAWQAGEGAGLLLAFFLCRGLARRRPLCRPHLSFLPGDAMAVGFHDRHGRRLCGSSGPLA